jgi:hypothetical protein
MGAGDMVKPVEIEEWLLAWYQPRSKKTKTEATNERRNQTA